MPLPFRDLTAAAVVRGGAHTPQLRDRALDVLLDPALAHVVDLVCWLEKGLVVDPSDVAVVLPVPRQPGVEPTRRLLTLITCTPKYSARYRLIVRGELVMHPDLRPDQDRPARLTRRG